MILCAHGVGFGEPCPDCGRAAHADPIATAQEMMAKILDAGGSQPGDYCDLIDDSVPDCDAMVGFYRANGSLYMSMPLEVYKHFRDKGAKLREKGAKVTT